MVSLPGPTEPNVLSLASQVIDVKKDFQAAGDGVTDDTVPIMKAPVRAAPCGRGDLLVYCGRHVGRTGVVGIPVQPTK